MTTTITIKNGKKLRKTNFLDIAELINYLIDKEGYGILHHLEEKEITKERQKRFDLALKTKKSKMLNI